MSTWRQRDYIFSELNMFHHHHPGSYSNLSDTVMQWDLTFWKLDKALSTEVMLHISCKLIDYLKLYCMHHIHRKCDLSTGSWNAFHAPGPHSHLQLALHGGTQTVSRVSVASSTFFFFYTSESHSYLQPSSNNTAALWIMWTLLVNLDFPFPVLKLNAPPSDRKNILCTYDVEYSEISSLFAATKYICNS